MTHDEAIERARAILDPARDAMLSPAQRAEELHAAHWRGNDERNV